MKVRILRFLNTVVSAASQFLQWVNNFMNLVDSKTSDLVINSPPSPPPPHLPVETSPLHIVRYPD